LHRFKTTGHIDDAIPQLEGVPTMRVFLTGAGGYLGSRVLSRLVADGHHVVALARSDGSAASAAAQGAEVVRGDLADQALLTEQARRADAFVHTALQGDASAPAVDRGVLDAVVAAYAGTSKPYIHTGGTAIHGDGSAITEDSPTAPPALLAWRPEILDAVRKASAEGIRTIVISPANVYGYGASVPALVTTGPRTEGDAPALLYPGTGSERMSNIHVDDLADLYVRALADAEPGSYLIAANDYSPTMREIAEAASTGLGLEGRVRQEAPEATQERLGLIAEVLLIDQRIAASRARELGWAPNGPALLDELATGSYAVPA
jgi:nucleoside-diphosphate-sugar epimerase